MPLKWTYSHTYIDDRQTQNSIFFLIFETHISFYSSIIFGFFVEEKKSPRCLSSAQEHFLDQDDIFILYCVSSLNLNLILN